jgi:hypothetical protein
MTEQTQNTALAQVELPPATSAEALLHAAVQKGADVEQLERLMALRQQIRAEQAKQAYDAAMARFQSLCPVIEKTKHVRFGNTDYSYAPLDKIIVSVRDLLAECGLSYAIDVDTDDAQITVTCTAKHIGGHSETSSMKVPLQDGKGMSEPQKYASAQTFAKRYAFCNAFGIMTGDEDDDNVSMREDGARYSTPEERREQRATVTRSPREPGETPPAAKELAAERAQRAKDAANAAGQSYTQPRFPSGEAQVIGPLEMQCTGHGATFPGPGKVGSVILEIILKGKPGQVVYYSADKMRKLTGLEQPHEYVGTITASVTRFSDGIVQIDSLTLGAMDELPPVVTAEELNAEQGAK